ncbi:MAG TPA: hypothetical protein ENF38_00590 [Candidatus Aenigmarchaeota archaeon]|nr:hypothetical protein [Candidatus Aenigmarchaeota archaeon]
MDRNVFKILNEIDRRLKELERKAEILESRVKTFGIQGKGREIIFFGTKLYVGFENSEYGRALAQLFKKGKIKLFWNDEAKDIVIEVRR